MRISSVCSVLLLGLILTYAVGVPAADDMSGGEEDSEGLFGTDNKGESGSGTTSSGETIMDSETLAPAPELNSEPLNFLSIKGTNVWQERNGLGAHAGFGGYTCMREYCDTTLDVRMAGSLSLILGGYFRFNPNWSVFVDLTIAHLNTNFRDSIYYNDVGDNKGIVVQFLFGPTFHLPLKGWLDIYTSLGIGPIALREKTSSGLKHRWGGFDFEWAIGADVYLWSVGVMKNFSFGPFMKFGFPVWAKVCEEDDSDNCARPSDMENQEYVFWSDTPFTFQMGLEARYDFTLFGNHPRKDPLPMNATRMEATPASSGGAGNDSAGKNNKGETKASGSGEIDL